MSDKTKTDRELLELAAKAAGITVNTVKQAMRDELDIPDCGLWTMTQTNWNPLKDPGDAFQLAVALRLDIIQCPDGKVEVTNQYVLEEDIRWAWESHGDDAFAATRRCITRAAAAIGEGL